MKSIAIGVGENKAVLKAVDIFLAENSNVEIKLIDNDDDIVKSILDNEIDGVVRGSLKASGVMKKLNNEFKFISRATYVNGGDDYEFLLAPVGIDEGKTLNDKLKTSIMCGNFLKKLSKTPKVAVLAGGRKGDYGRSAKISKSIDNAWKLCELIENNTDFEVKNYYILVEQAIKDKCNIIIAPDGIIGNIIFRTLVLLDDWPSNGAITFGINSIYIDTSRDQNTTGYLRSLKLAYKLANI